ncbi:MAG: IPT/TIG domain-containing protein, partial [Planctomycetes bacterium]|nr:IPT/TIG domain-containing protein [Planctomycetota bacterium]
MVLTYAGGGSGIGPSATPAEILTLQFTADCAATGTLAVSFVDGYGSPALDNTVHIAGGTTASPQLQNGSVTVVAPDPVTDLDCTAADCSTVDLTWTVGGTYDSIRVRRDGADLATLAGDASSYQDAAATPGTRTYAVIGIRGSLSSTPATCGVSVPECAPTIASVTPSQGPTAGGTSVTIGGTNFRTGATVTFGGTPATSVVVVSST